MAKIEFKPVEERDIEELLLNIAEDDEREILGLGVSVEHGIRSSVETSVDVMAIRDPKGRLACIVGLTCTQGLAPEYYPWLIGTASMQEYPLSVMRLSRKILGHWRSQHPYMSNVVDSRHSRAIAWLKALGAELDFIPEYGPYRRPYYRFTFGAQPCA